MKSILYFNTDTERIISEQSIVDLSLRHTIEQMHRGNLISEFIVRVFSTPCDDIDTIIGRQQVLMDFINNSGTVKKLSDLCKVIYEKSEERKKNSRSYTANPYQVDQSGWILAIQSVSELILEILNHYECLSNTISELKIKSQWLIDFQNELMNIIGSESFGKLYSLLIPLTSIRTLDTSYICRAELLDDFKKINYRLIIPVQKMHVHKDQDNEVFRMSVLEMQFAKNITTLSLRSLYTFLLEMSEILVEPFLSLKEELMFYDFAERYCQILQDRKISYVWPRFNNNKTEYAGLRDIYLSLCDLIPPVGNNYSENKLSIVTGPNNSGKTVFLRSIGTAQLFAQAGLPVPAITADVCIKHNIFTVYATSEKDTGRFEEECQMIANIIDTIEINDLLLMNEPFQSTSYTEAIQILAGILEAFNEVGIHVILVTHLSDYISISQNIPSVDLYKTNVEYKLEKILTD